MGGIVCEASTSDYKYQIAKLESMTVLNPNTSTQFIILHHSSTLVSVDPPNVETPFVQCKLELVR